MTRRAFLGSLGILPWVPQPDSFTTRDLGRIVWELHMHEVDPTGFIRAHLIRVRVAQWLQMVHQDHLDSIGVPRVPDS